MHAFVLVSKCGLTTNEGLLMVFVIAPIAQTQVDENSELAVKISEDFIPIQQITGLLVGSKSPSLAEKPKVFFFLDFDAGTNVDGPSVSHFI
jgi:hypothetical protein